MEIWSLVMFNMSSITCVFDVYMLYKKGLENRIILFYSLSVKWGKICSIQFGVYGCVVITYTITLKYYAMAQTHYSNIP